jgi:hypothetical protein
MSPLSQDVRYAIRALLATPGFTAIAVVSLAIGIGANTAIFSVTNALLLRPLPYKNADRQVILWNTSPGLGIMEDWFSTAQYFDIRNGQQSFEDVAIAIGANANLTGDGDPERVGTIRVSSNLLPMLGVRPLLGDLLLLVVRQGTSIAVIGMVLGLAGAFALTRFMRTLLYGVQASDPATFAAIAATLTLVALVACFVPARRAARIDPIVSLRTE